jgi:uncharacterized protein (TIGR03083 family)
MTDHIAALGSAADLLVSVVDTVPDDGWDEPGLGSWTVRDLVAHALRGLTTVEDYLEHPVETAADPEAYAAPEAVAARGRAAVAALGDDPPSAVRETRDRVLALVAATPLSAQLGTPFGERSLGSYLPSRTAELTVHSIDLADALGVTASVPDRALRETIEFLGTFAARQGQGISVIRALSGRAALPDGFSVY